MKLISSLDMDKLEINKIPIYAICLILLLYILCFLSCKYKESPNPILLLNSNFTQISDISSISRCEGPNGKYNTNVSSKKDGFMVFSQTFEYRDAPFMAQLTADNKGYVINEHKEIQDTLSSTSIEMIRSHDFHRLQTNPNHFFDGIKFKKKIDSNTELYSAVDNLGNPAQLYYDRKLGQLERIEFRNMMDTTEIIEVIFKNWIDSDYGMLVEELDVIQAKKDTFNFVFENIEINKEAVYDYN